MIGTNQRMSLPAASAMNYINLSNRTTTPNQQPIVNVNAPGVGIRGALPSPVVSTTAPRHVLPVTHSNPNHHQPKMTNHNHASGGGAAKGGPPAGVQSQQQHFQHRPMPSLPGMPASMQHSTSSMPSMNPSSSSSFVTAAPAGGGQPIVRIRTPHPHDVLCGRGGGINSHPGNKTFRAWVHQRKEDYNLAPSKQDKAAVSREVMDRVRALNPPGRFLTREENTNFKGGSSHHHHHNPAGGVTGFWIEIDDNKAMAKTSQALREGAPKIRAAHNVGPDGKIIPDGGESSEGGRQPQRRKRKASSAPPASAPSAQPPTARQPQQQQAPPGPASPQPQSRKVTDEEIKRHIRDAVAATRSMPRGKLNHIGTKAFPPSPRALSTAAQAAENAAMSPPGARRPTVAGQQGPPSPAASGPKSPRSPGSSQSSLTQRLLLGQQQQKVAAAAAAQARLHQLRQQAVAGTAVPSNLVIPPPAAQVVSGSSSSNGSASRLGAGVGGLNGLMKAPDLSASFNVNAVGKRNGGVGAAGGGGGGGPSSGGDAAAAGDMTTPPLIPMSLQSPPITPRGGGGGGVGMGMRKKSSSSSIGGSSYGSAAGHLMRAHSLATSDIAGPLDSDTLDEVFTDPFSADTEAANAAAAAAAREGGLNSFEFNPDVAVQGGRQQQGGANAPAGAAPAVPASALTGGGGNGYNVTWNLNQRRQQQQQPSNPQRQQPLSPMRQHAQGAAAALAAAMAAPPPSSPMGGGNNGGAAISGNVNRTAGAGAGGVLARQVSNRSTASTASSNAGGGGGSIGSLNSADLIAMYGGGTNASRITS